MRKDKFMKIQDKRRQRQEGRHAAFVRVISTICAVVLLCAALVGCDLGGSSEELIALREEISEAALRIEALEGQNATAKEEIDVLESLYAAAEEEIDALESRNEEAEEEIDALESRNEEAEKELDALESQNAAAEAEISKLEDEIKELESSMTKKIRIYIDQGHNPSGNHNSGASGNGLNEEDLTFLIGYMLAELLEKDARFEVCLSRPTEDTVLGTDNDSSLDARVRGAEEWEADYFISLHTNAADNEAASGIEVLVAEEGGVSYAFGSKLLAGVLDSTDLYDRGMKLRPELRVLKNTTMPAALIEMGFITNKGDAALLSEHPERFARGIYEGILAYFGLPSCGVTAN